MVCFSCKLCRIKLNFSGTLFIRTCFITTFGLGYCPVKLYTCSVGLERNICSNFPLTSHGRMNITHMWLVHTSVLQQGITILQTIERQFKQSLKAVSMQTRPSTTGKCFQRDSEEVQKCRSSDSP